MATQRTGASLRDRAQATSQEVATRGGQVERVTQDQTLAKQIQQMQAQFEKAMPRGMEAQQLVRDALTALRTTKNLGVAEPTSVLGALMNCAQLGLRVGVLGQAWVLPFYDKNLETVRTDDNGMVMYKANGDPQIKLGGFKAQLIVGYQGLIELAHRSGRVQSLIARTVYEADTFDVDYGTEDKLIHKPELFGDRGKPIAYYSVVKTVTGGTAFWVMSQSDVERHRDLHAPRNKNGQITGPWVNHFESMALKTTLKQLAKWMPKSTELATAIAVDETVRVDVTPDMPAVEASVAITPSDYNEPPQPTEQQLPVEEPPAEYDPTTEQGWGQGGEVR